MQSIGDYLKALRGNSRFEGRVQSRQAWARRRNAGAIVYPDVIVPENSKNKKLNAIELVSEGLRLLEQREQEAKAKLEWLRAAAKEGFDSADQGDYATLRSDREIDDFVDNMRMEASEKLVAKKERG